MFGDAAQLITQAGLKKLISVVGTRASVAPLLELEDDLLPDTLAADLTDDQAVCYAWWALQRLQTAGREVEKSWREAQLQRKNAKEAAEAMGRTMAQATLGGSRQGRGGGSYGPPNFFAGGYGQPSFPAGGMGQPGYQGGRGGGRLGGRGGSNGPPADNSRLLQELQRGVAAYKGPDGRDLCLGYLRGGYLHKDFSMEPPGCSRGDCGKAHARLPEGATFREWRPNGRIIQDTGLVAVPK